MIFYSDYDFTKSNNAHAAHASRTFTWLASSLVGEMTRALNPLLRGLRRWASRGKQKAMVLPDPVGAHAKISLSWNTQIDGAKRKILNQHATTDSRLNCKQKQSETWRTCIIRGMACIWMGVGVWKPAVLMFWMICGSRLYSFCSSSKVDTGSGMSVPWTFIRFWWRIRLT